ncbi:MAG TPA: HD domain-containing protein, partial [Burkholderiales bacterium]|nr:HD domain-containing protein [Burkholderiales bacterium]
MTVQQYDETDLLDRANAAFAEAMVDALDVREHETGNHSRRVACHTLVLARHFIGDPQQLRQVYWGALLHDIGKIGVPEAILLKAGELNEAEWEVMRTHPEKGHRIVAQLPGMTDAA